MIYPSLLCINAVAAKVDSQLNTSMKICCYRLWWEINTLGNPLVDVFKERRQFRLLGTRHYKYVVS